MKFNLLNATVITASVSIAIFINGCSKAPEKRTPVPIVSATVITSVSPSTGRAGETITIYGNNLVQDTAGFTVTVDNKKAAVTLFTNDSVKAIVPEKAGSGKVVITTAGKSFEGPEFKYISNVIVTTVAGSGGTGTSDGIGANASFNCPWGIVADDNGDLYIADTYNRLIRKISAAGQQVSTIPIPPLVGNSSFYSPYNITIDKRSKSLYVTDFNEHLMKVTASGDMEVIMTNTQPLAGIAIGPDDKLYVGNNSTGTIFRLDTTGQNINTYASGIITPRNIIFDKDNIMFIGAYGIYKVTGAGSDSVVVDGSLFHGWEIAVDTSGNFYEADHFNNVIRKIEKNGDITIIAGSGDASDVDGNGLDASFNGPQGITIDKDGNLYVTTFNYTTSGGNKVRKITFK